MDPHDTARGVQLRTSSSVPFDEGNSNSGASYPSPPLSSSHLPSSSSYPSSSLSSSAPVSAGAAAAAAATLSPHGVGRPSSFVPDAFCCIHPMALEQRQQQSSGDWKLRATSKAVRSEGDLRRWLSSDTHADFLSFVSRLARQAAGKKTLSSLSSAIRGNRNTQSESSSSPAAAAATAATTPTAAETGTEAAETQTREGAATTTNTAAAAAAAAAAASAATAAVERTSATSRLGLLSSFLSFNRLPSNKACWALLDVLQQLLQWVEDIPPVEQPTRFGNQAFKVWCRRLQEEAEDLLSGVWTACEDVEISETEKKEMVDIFCSSFGNPVRLDFGTGHECSFAIFLFCLFKKKIIKEEEHDPFAVLGIFKGYVQVAHALQQRYMLEAAGSRGVWGLDDFHFLTFLWGAGQLSEQQLIEPAQIMDRELVQQLAPDLLYFDSIEYVLQTKKGAPFFECSPILYDVSGISSWKKICSGLIRMYEGEVMCKLPIVQHFLFGSLFPLSG